MAGLVLACLGDPRFTSDDSHEDVDARDKRGHDEPGTPGDDGKGRREAVRDAVNRIF
jgi:hypothetical protein